MQGKLLVIIVIAAAMVSGCARQSIRLSPGANVVKVAKSDPTDNYTEIGPVSGLHGNGCGGFGRMGSYEGAVTDLKNRAYSMGADYVQIMTISEPHAAPGCFVNTYKISGTAYKQIRSMPSPLPIIEQSSESAIVKRLRELQSLRNDGVITQKEFEELKSRAIKQE